MVSRRYASALERTPLLSFSRGEPMSEQSAASGSTKGKVTLRWLGHAAFEIESSGGTRLLVDPFIRDNPATPRALKDLARYEGSDKPHAILVSHSHGDHSANAKEIARM